MVQQEGELWFEIATTVFLVLLHRRKRPVQRDAEKRKTNITSGTGITYFLEEDFRLAKRAKYFSGVHIFV
jgi:hypothetical protein